VSDEQTVSDLGRVRLRWRDDERELDLRVHLDGVDDDGCTRYAVHVSSEVARSVFADAVSVVVDVLPARTALGIIVGDETDGVLS